MIQAMRLFACPHGIPYASSLVLPKLASSQTSFAGTPKRIFPFCAHTQTHPSMLRSPNNSPLHVRPVDTLIQRLIDQPNKADILASDNIQSQRHLSRRLALLDSSDNAFDGVVKDLQPNKQSELPLYHPDDNKGESYQIRRIIPARQISHKVAPVCGDDAYALWNYRIDR